MCPRYKPEDFRTARLTFKSFKSLASLGSNSNILYYTVYSSNWAVPPHMLWLPQMRDWSQISRRTQSTKLKAKETPWNPTDFSCLVLWVALCPTPKKLNIRGESGMTEIFSRILIRAINNGFLWLWGNGVLRCCLEIWYFFLIAFYRKYKNST